MKIFTFSFKSLLLAAGLMLGSANAWADPIETIGSLSSDWWTDFSSTYTLEGYGKYHFQFTTTNANDGNSYKTWLLVATNGNDSHGGGGTEYFVWRADNYAWGQGTNSNDTPSKLVCSNTYSTANPTGAGLQTAMNGAAVDMVITRESNNIYVTATVTPSNGENEFTMSFSYLYGNATSANIGLFFTVQNAQVVLNTAEQTASWSTVWTADFSSAPSGMTYSVTNGSTSIANGYLEYHQGGGSGNRAINTAFTDSKFAVDTNWKMDFDWNCSSANANSSNVAFATNNGTAFTMTWASYASAVVVTDASSTQLTNTLPLLGYNIPTCSSWSHITIIGVKDDGIYLTITNGTTTYVNNVKVSSTFGYPATFNGSLGRAASHMYIDNVGFSTPAVAGFVATPTSTITGAYNTGRKFTLECLTPNTTIYYATSDLEKGDAGWSVYSSEVTTSDATIYAYAEDDKGNTSDKMNFATGAGTTVNLAGATVTHSGNGQYTIANSQSAVLGTPTATVHYQIDGGSELTSTSTSFIVNITTDGTLTYWLTADGYGSVDPEDETVYAPRGYAATTTIDFRTSDINDWAIKGDAVDVDGDANTYYKYKDQSGNILGDGLLATTFINDGSSWRIQRYNGGTAPYNNTEYVALKGLEAGQLVQIACGSAPTIVSNLTAVPASTYTGTYTYTATAAGDVIVSLGKGVNLRTIKLCETTVQVAITAAGWTTFSSSYALDLSNMTATNSVKAFYAYGIDGTSVTLKETATTGLASGEGIMLKGTAGDVVTIPVVASGDAIAGNKLVGCPTGGTVPSGKYVFAYAKADPAGTACFYPVSENTDISEGKAYLGDGSSAKSLRIVVDGGQASEVVAPEVAETEEPEVLFNMAGIQVDKNFKGFVVNQKGVKRFNR